jgi:hypothetical protein
LVNITDFPRGKECNNTTSLNESLWDDFSVKFPTKQTDSIVAKFEVPIAYYLQGDELNYNRLCEFICKKDMQDLTSLMR